MTEEYIQLLKDNILAEENFIRAIFSGQRRGDYVPWLKATIRPLLIKNQRQLQFSYFEPQRNITKNYHGADIAEKLDQLLALPFKNYYVETGTGVLQVRITKKGKAIIHQSRAAQPEKVLSLEHDRQKNQILPAGTPDPFLQAVGIMTQDGKIRTHMQSKYRQINEFLKLINETIDPKLLNKSPLHVFDFGCGNAYLTFAAYHYLNHILGIPASLTGVDIRADLLQKHAETAQVLGWPNISFQPVKIADFQPAVPADIVLALHACDIATDEAIAQGIKMQSRFIFSAPCCHHHLQQQLDRRPAPPAFQAVLRHNSLKEQLGTILTDAFRAAILRMMGYNTDVVQFVSSEHTPKNLMIRAVKTARPGESRFVQEYEELKALWQVRPYLEDLLAEELAPGPP